MNAEIGEIWLVTIPILSFNEAGDVNINIQRRPCLIVDDGEV